MSDTEAAAADSVSGPQTGADPENWEEHEVEPEQEVEDASPPQPPSPPEKKITSAEAGGQESEILNKSGRRAQRTRRVKIAPATAQSPAPTKDAKHKKPAKPEAETLDAEDDTYEYEEEPPKLVLALLHLGEALFVALKGLCRLLWRLVRSLTGVLPFGLGLAIFGLSVYLVSEYLVEAASEYEMTSFDVKLKYVLRSHIWTLVPTVLASIVHTMRKAEGHRRFAGESFWQGALLCLNTAVMSTHVETKYLHCIWSLVVVSAVYSCIYWVNLLYCGSRMRTFFGSPSPAVVFMLTLYNFGCILGEDLGYLTPVETQMPEQGTSSGYWQFRDICSMVERVFCYVDGQPRRRVVPRSTIRYWSF